MRNESRIIRLRGDAPELTWPAAMEPLIEWCHELRRLTPDPEYVKADGLARTAAHRLLRDWERTFIAAQATCATAFGAAQGWQVSQRWRPRDLMSPAEGRGEPRRLLLPRWVRDDAFEHPTFYSDQRRLAGAVIHLYAPIKLDRLPRSIVVDELPASHYFPRWTIAYVLRPAAAVAQRLGR